MAKSSVTTPKRTLLQLKKYSVAGIVPEFVDLKYLYVELDSAIYYNNFTGSASEILSEVTTGLDTYSKSLSSNKFGGRVKYSKVVSIIDNIHEAITSNITKVKIRRNLRAEIGRNAQYELCYGNKFHSRSEGYSIKSVDLQYLEFPIPYTLQIEKLTIKQGQFSSLP